MPRSANSPDKSSMLGTKGNDILVGLSGHDFMKGLRGDDTISGLGGNDTLTGGPGDDILIGGLGSDLLRGGRGLDTFRYLTLDDSNAANGIDTIRDFDPDQDRIDLSALGSAILVSSYQPGLTSVMQATLSYSARSNVTTVAFYQDSVDPSFQIHVNGNLSDVQGINGIFTPLLVTFEDLGPWQGTEISVPHGYIGFDWVVPDHLDVGDDTLFVLRDDRISTQGTGYQLGSIDPGEWVAYTPNGSQPVTISRSDRSDFIFDQVYLTAAWDELQAVTITGYNNEAVVGTFAGTINNDGPTLIDVDWGAIDTLVISNSTLVGDGGSFPRPNLVLDNFLFYI